MTPSISIIISYYKALGNLKLILSALNVQSDMDFEVIISEDDSNPETIDFVSSIANAYQFPIQHNHQTEDLGFRKNMMLNRAILSSRANMLVFIDGDCIPHRHFVKAYIQEKKSTNILIGRRVMLGPEITKSIQSQKSFSPISLLQLLRSDSTKIKDGIYSYLLAATTKTRGLVGCNWGISKGLLIAVNGYDEDYITAGVGEDNDIEWRLTAHGVGSQSMKNKAIVYHLHHKRSYTEDVIFANMKIWKDKQKEGHIQCLNGIEKIKH